MCSVWDLTTSAGGLPDSMMLTMSYTDFQDVHVKVP